MQSIRCVVIGDYAVGKSCLLSSFTKNKFPREFYEFAPYDDYNACLVVDGKPINLCMCAIPDQDMYDRLRPLRYTNTDVFLICFSLIDKRSFENVETRWYPEVNHYCPITPIVLVGTKLDLREDKKTIEDLKSKNKSPVTFIQGLDMKRGINASAYIGLRLFNLCIIYFIKKYYLINFLKSVHL
jgi:small GTP-binding protein